MEPELPPMLIFHVWQAHLALEEAEVRMWPSAEVEQLERVYLEALATYTAARMANDASDADA